LVKTAGIILIGQSESVSYASLGGPVWLVMICHRLAMPGTTSVPSLVMSWFGNNHRSGVSLGPAIIWFRGYCAGAGRVRAVRGVTL